jgi:hypothetical protein
MRVLDTDQDILLAKYLNHVDFDVIEHSKIFGLVTPSISLESRNDISWHIQFCLRT